MEKKVKEGARAEIVLNILLFLVARGSSHAHQSKSKDIWVLSGKKKKKAAKQTPDLPQFCLSHPPYSHTPGLEFPVDGPVQTPTLLQKTYFEDEHERQKGGGEKTTEYKCMS